MDEKTLKIGIEENALVLYWPDGKVKTAMSFAYPSDRADWEKIVNELSALRSEREKKEGLPHLDEWKSTVAQLKVLSAELAAEKEKFASLRECYDKVVDRGSAFRDEFMAEKEKGKKLVEALKVAESWLRTAFNEEGNILFIKKALESYSHRSGEKEGCECGGVFAYAGDKTQKHCCSCLRPKRNGKKTGKEAQRHHPSVHEGWGACSLCDLNVKEGKNG